MTELSILGPADPLGHIVLLENHRDDGPVADLRESLPDGVASVHEHECSEKCEVDSSVYSDAYPDRLRRLIAEHSKNRSTAEYRTERRMLDEMRGPAPAIGSQTHVTFEIMLP